MPARRKGEAHDIPTGGGLAVPQAMRLAVTAKAGLSGTNGRWKLRASKGTWDRTRGSAPFLMQSTGPVH